MIRRVELTNFKAHERAVFRLEEGVVFIHGPNGAGKTSLMEAISVALFGSQWVRRVGGRWSDFLRLGAPYGEVKLALEHRGDEVVVTRRFEREGGDARLYVNNVLAARGDKEVTTELMARLGLNVEEYRHLLYIRQGELRRILEEDYLDRLFRLDEFDKVAEIIKEIRLELEKKRERAAGRVETLEREVASLKREVEELKARLGEVEGRLKELEKTAAGFREVEERYLKLRERQASLAKEAESLERRWGEYVQTAVDLEREVEGLKKELEAIWKAREELQLLPQLGDIEGEYFTLRERVEKAERTPPAVRSFNPQVLEEKRRERDETMRRHAALSSKLKLLRDVIKLAKSAQGGRCPICNSPLGRDVVWRHELEATELEKEVEELGALLQRLHDEVKKLEEIERLYQKYKELDVDETAKRRLRELEDLYNMKKEVERKRAALLAQLAREAEVLRRLEEKERKKSETERKAEEMGRRIREVEAELKDVETQLAEVESTYRQAKTLYEEYLQKSSLAAQWRKELGGKEGRLAKAVEELEREKRELQKLEKAVELGRHMEKVIKEVKPAVRQILIKGVNTELNKIFLQLRHKESFRSIQLVENNGRYSVRVNTEGGPIDFRQLSLGEQNLVALSLRVAVARALLGWAPFMMLDEPTEHLDESHRRGIVELVRGLASVVPLVIVTSHLGEFEEAASLTVELAYRSRSQTGAESRAT
ncbi:MAG: AAA family ATPase [Pyrobaculum sp.]